MTLRGEIEYLRDSVLADLSAAHDYYANTQVAWGIVRQLIANGRKFSVQNVATGTVTNETELAGKSRGYEAEELANATFQQFVSIFENFFFDLIRLWLTAYPQSLGSKTIDFQTVLDAADNGAITTAVINKEINSIAYERPAAWFKYLNEKVSLGCPTPEEINRLTEAKASRDVLVHSRGTVNKIYESKAGTLARYKSGARLEVPEQYHRDTWALIRKVITDISNAAIAKAT